MVEAKGPGYADLLSKSLHQQEDIGASAKLLEQAGRQVQAAGARPIIWFFAEESAADYVRNLFKDDVRLRQIEVIPYPPTGGN
jgi:NADPH-dependent ferric siderophore reductase